MAVVIGEDFFPKRYKVEASSFVMVVALCLFGLKEGET